MQTTQFRPEDRGRGQEGKVGTARLGKTTLRKGKDRGFWEQQEREGEIFVLNWKMVGNYTYWRSEGLLGGRGDRHVLTSPS